VPPLLAGTVDPHEPTDARDRRQPCHMSTRSMPGRWSEDNRRFPDRTCCGAPGSRAGQIDPAPGSSGHRASPPSPVDRQSSSPGRGHRDGDTADPRWCRPPCRNRRAPLSGPRRVTMQGWSPTTSMSISSPRRARSPARTSCWSSTSSTRIMPSAVRAGGGPGHGSRRRGSPRESHREGARLAGAYPRDRCLHWTERCRCGRCRVSRW